MSLLETCIAGQAGEENHFAASTTGTDDDCRIDDEYRDGLNGYLRKVASSQDGSKVAIAGSHGDIWLSSDFGSSFTKVDGDTYDANDRIPGEKDWHGIASSADGATLAAVSHDEDDAGTQGNIWISWNSGVSFAPVSFAGWDTTRAWESIAMSADGSRLAAVVTGGSIWISSNSGVSFSAVAGTSGALAPSAISSNMPGLGAFILKLLPEKSHW